MKNHPPLFRRRIFDIKHLFCLGFHDE
ncbi:hypothetical protein A2U01_0114146, partial [Trifolium medium]|nr:hypothetical protein [Trifolium medium]